MSSTLRYRPRDGGVAMGVNCLKLPDAKSPKKAAGHGRHYDRGVGSSYDHDDSFTRATSRVTDSTYESPISPLTPGGRHPLSPYDKSNKEYGEVPRHVLSMSRRPAADDGHRDPPPPLSWRLHPDESLSDWVLTVASTDSVSSSPRKRRSSNVAFDHENSDIKTESINADSTLCDDETVKDDLVKSMCPPARKYHVHRAQLAVGPHRSDYFATLFKNRRRMIKTDDMDTERANDSNETFIELKASAAAAFPIMLDFVYSPMGTPIEATTESAVALKHLASCFGIREMFNNVTEFIKRDLRPETAPQYLLEASTYKHDKLIAASLKLCAESFQTIKLSTIVILTPDLFELVVRSTHLVCDSEVLSTRVASYCRCRPGAVDLETLLSLTDASIMPKIAPDESLFYIHLLSLIGVDLPDQSKAGAAPTLYERCVAASPNVIRGALHVKHSPLCTHTSSFHERYCQTINKDYDELPAGIKVELLESAIADSCMLDRASSGTHKEDAETDNSEQRSKAKKHSSDEFEFELAAAKEVMQDLQGEIKHLRRKLEKTVDKYETKLSDREDEVRRCIDELAKFVRVPNTYDLPSKCTYQEDMEFNKYGESMFGQIPPTSMPRFGREPKDGLIFRETERFDTRYWPMFYFKGDKN